MKAIVLAAGVGSRLDPLTTQMPKPMVPVANIPVIEHIFRLLNAHGIKDIACNLHYLPEQISNYFQGGNHLGMNISFLQEEVLSGDAGGVRALRRFLDDEAFLVMMGDLLTDADLTYLTRQHQLKGAMASIALKQVDDVSQFGVALLDGQQFIKGFQEKPQPAQAVSNLASTGIYVLQPEVFDYIPVDGPYGFGRQLFPDLVARGLPVAGLEIRNYWSDVGTVKQYRLSNFAALQGHVDVKLPGYRTSWGWAAEGSCLHEKAKIEGLLMLGAGSKVASGVKIRGHVVIGDNCLVEQDVEIEDTVIWSGVNIEKKAVIKDSVIGRNCLVKNGSLHLEKATVVSLASSRAAI